MDFDSASAMQEYIADGSMSYAKIAKKYGVSPSKIGTLARKEGWVRKRAEHMFGICPEGGGDDEKRADIKLSLLRKSADKTIEELYAFLSEYEKPGLNELKNAATVLKTLTAVQRDLNNLPTYKEENSIYISREKLQLVRDKITFDSDSESETGIALIPFAEEDFEDDENVIYEGEEDV